MKHSCCPVTLGFSSLLILVFLLEQFFGVEPFVLHASRLIRLQLILSFLAHASLTHLLSNLFGILLFGILLEADSGSHRLAVLILLSGMLVNLALPLTGYEAVIGASGIAYALAAALAIRKPFGMIPALGIPMPGMLAIILWILQQLILEGTRPVAYKLHLAGMLIGSIFALLTPHPRRKETVQRDEEAEEIDRLLDAYEEEYLLPDPENEKNS